MGPQEALISISSAFRQTPAEAARPRLVFGWFARFLPGAFLSAGVWGARGGVRSVFFFFGGGARIPDNIIHD